MLGVAVGKNRGDATPAELPLVRRRAVGAISLDSLRTPPWSARLAGDRRNRINERQELCHVVRIGSGDDGRQRNAVGIGQHVMLAPRLAAIRSVAARFCPPSTARAVALSMTARDQSIWSALRRRANNKRCNCCQTPASCQSCSRRQQVIPLPQPISCGSISQGIPLRSTNKMPVSASRLPMGGRPPLGYSRGAGNSDSISAHRSSETNGLAMAVLRDPENRTHKGLQSSSAPKSQPIPFC